jgi:hypothetical protein
MYLAYLVQVALGFNVLLAFVYQEGTSAVLTAVFFFFIGLLPYLFTWKTKIVFPWFVYFLISLALLVHVSGYIQERYITYPNWDVIAHTISGTMVAIIGFLAVIFLDKIRKYNLDPGFIAVAIVFFGMGFEYLWEIYEFFMDTFFGGSLAGLMQPSNADTMSDMIFVLLSSVIVAVICYVYLKHHGKEKVMHDMVKASAYFKE